MVEQASANAPTLERVSGATYWLTGLSGSGKSTLAEAAKEYLDKEIGDTTSVFCLDGDIIRQGMNKGLGFTPADRAENIRRVGEVSKLFNQAGQIVFCSFIAPEAGPRDIVADTHAKANLTFCETYISTPIEVCEERDPKGMYKKARAGIIPGFTGVSPGATYDEPKAAGLVIDTAVNNLEACVQMIVDDMIKKGCLRKLNAKRVVDTLVVASQELVTKAMTEKYACLELAQMETEFLQTIGEGWAYPLKGFMNEMELLECLQMKTLTVNGERHLMSVPITQHCSEEFKKANENADHIALKWNGQIVAIINKPVFFENRTEEICTRTFGCFETSHPMAENIMAQGPWLISGESTDFCKKIQWNDGLDKYRMTPKQINDEMVSRGADAVFAFQVRNPLHNGHCLLLKDTRKQLLAKGYKNPVLLLHPLGGWCKDDDVPLAPRIKQHQALIDDGTLDRDHIVLAVWPSPMFYGGPTEVLWHASSRVGCGITHFITGRDPAGVGHPTKKGTNLYDGWHGQKLLVHSQGLLGGVEVYPFKVAALNQKTDQMEFFSPSHPDAKSFKFVSGSEMRKYAADNVEPPKGFMSPAGWKVLKEHYAAEAAKK